MPGTLVAKCSSISTIPRGPVLMPTFWRPRPSVYGTRPVAERMTSASIVSWAPPLTGSTTSVAPPPGFAVAEMTLVPSLKSIPCFFRMRWKSFATSLSMPGVMRSRNSTTVTLEPSLFQTEPISRPITPAPITTSFSGTLSNSRAPVLSTMIFPSLSTGTPGSLDGSEPDAITIFFAFRETVSEPSIGCIATSPAALISPVPL
mmetsp:Transcript_14595/g.44568  ORF Transcript_14595/g.44568 Transcript_14595/m.44568 type:complete len:203 (+) Transcript_14595:809-1417(+)